MSAAKKPRLENDENAIPIQNAVAGAAPPRPVISDWRLNAQLLQEFIRTTLAPEKYYIVQYDKIIEKQIKQAVVNANDLAWSVRNAVNLGEKRGQQAGAQEVFIRDDGYIRLAFVIYEANSYEKACTRLQQLKRDCFEMLYARPPPNQPKAQTPFLLLQYNSGLDNVIYDIAHRAETVMENDNKFTDIVAYINDNDTLYQSMIIKATNNPYELAQDLKLIATKCLTCHIRQNHTEMNVQMPLGNHPTDVINKMRREEELIRMENKMQQESSQLIQAFKIVKETKERLQRRLNQLNLLSDNKAGN